MTQAPKTIATPLDVMEALEEEKRPVRNDLAVKNRERGTWRSTFVESIQMLLGHQVGGLPNRTLLGAYVPKHNSPAGSRLTSKRLLKKRTLHRRRKHGRSV